jgi:DNA-binding transcriptional MerR regulator
MLLISEFARAGNVTIRALRFYDEVGLLSPAHVVPENSYRWYSPAQFAQLNQIQAFKDIGFSLREIRELLQQRLTPQELRAALEERREVLRKRVLDNARTARGPACAIRSTWSNLLPLPRRGRRDRLRSRSIPQTSRCCNSRLKGI